MIAIPIGIMILAVCGALLYRYQRQLNAHFRQEMQRREEASAKVVDALLDDSRNRCVERNEMTEWLKDPQNDWHIRQWNGTVLVARQHPQTRELVIAKKYTDKDTDYARRCAEELVEKLNEL